MAEMECKCVLVLDGGQEPGVRANTAAILGFTLGARYPELVGPGAPDADGRVHPGIITTPIPVLRSTAEGLRDLYEKLSEEKFSGVFCTDFSDVAQCCQTYPVYLEKAAATPTAGHTFLGLGLCGEKKLVNKLTGSLPLLR